ncbi:MAG: glycerate kinase [Spirochaetia bacterium]
MGAAELRLYSQRIQQGVRAAAEPARSVKRALVRTGTGFAVQGREFPTEGALNGTLAVIAVGKASLAMAAAAREVLGRRASECLVIVPRGYPGEALDGSGVRILRAGHPLPDDDGLEAARQVTAMVQGLGANDVCLYLISGGSSSLLPLPLPGVSLRDLVDTTALLLRSGAEIRELNTVRKHVSEIGGGRLARSCRGTIVTMAISDVVGDDLSVVGSGPTVPDPTTFSDAHAVLARYNLLARVPASVRALLENGQNGLIEETPKRLPDRHAAFIVASSALAVEAAAEEARACGFAPLVLTSSLEGEAREAGRLLASVARESRARGRPVAAPACIIAAGETTVTVRGDGTGGRNQEIALAAAIQLRGEPGILLTSFATDGIEGNSGAAGGYASSDTLAEGERAGLDARACLERNDANAFLSAAGALIVTGPTGTNVNDITFALVEKTL